MRAERYKIIFGNEMSKKVCKKAERSKAKYARKYGDDSAVRSVRYSVNGTAVGCAGLKPYSDSDAEIKRVWVERNYRRNHIADELMNRVERKAMERGFQRTILQTRLIMKDAVGLYLKHGYCQIENYPPYDQLDGAVCFAKVL